MIQLDERTHQYSLNGKPYWSVTQILSSLKLTPPYPEEDAGDKKRFGQACHKAVELAMWDRLDMERTHPQILPYVIGVMEKKREMNIRPIATEMRVWDPWEGTAGTLDLFCWVYDYELAVIDYKSGGAPRCTQLQLAGYIEHMKKMIQTGLLEMPVHPVSGARLAIHAGYPVRRFSMKLQPHRAISTEYRDPFDHHAWNGAVQLFKWLESQRKDMNQ